jgi:hypothetical protein
MTFEGLSMSDRQMKVIFIQNDGWRYRLVKWLLGGQPEATVIKWEEEYRQEHPGVVLLHISASAVR